MALLRREGNNAKKTYNHPLLDLQSTELEGLDRDLVTPTKQCNDKKLSFFLSFWEQGKEGRYNLQSSPTGPAEQPAGGSLDRSCISYKRALVLSPILE